MGANPINWIDPAGLAPLPENIKLFLGQYYPGLDLNKIDIKIGIPTVIKKYSPVDPVAVTIGNTIYFDKNYYDPCSAKGISLIAHELTHSYQFNWYGYLGFATHYGKDYLTNLILMNKMMHTIILFLREKQI